MRCSSTVAVYRNFVWRGLHCMATLTLSRCRMPCAVARIICAPDLSPFTVPLQEMTKRLVHSATECTEKADLVYALLTAGGSSACTCAICFEDYNPGDAMRVLPCLHRFHLSCIDQWILQQARRRSNTAQSTVSYECPLCHARL